MSFTKDADGFIIEEIPQDSIFIKKTIEEMQAELDDALARLAGAQSEVDRLQARLNEAQAL